MHKISIYTVFFSIGIPFLLLSVENTKRSSVQEQLANAVETEDVSSAKHLLMHQEVSPNFFYILKKDKVSPFQHPIFKYSRTTKELTPLISAILSANRELFDLLLSNGASVLSRRNPPIKWVLQGISALKRKDVAESFSPPFTEWYELQRLAHIRRHMATQLLVHGARLWLPKNEEERHFLLEAAYQADLQRGTPTFEKMIPPKQQIMSQGHSFVGEACVALAEWSIAKSHQLAVSSQDVTQKGL